MYYILYRKYQLKIKYISFEISLLNPFHHPTHSTHSPRPLSNLTDACLPCVLSLFSVCSKILYSGLWYTRVRESSAVWSLPAFSGC